MIHEIKAIYTVPTYRANTFTNNLIEALMLEVAHVMHGFIMLARMTIDEYCDGNTHH